MKLVSKVACCQRKRKRLAGDESTLKLAPRNHLGAPDDEVMRQHTADDHKDQGEIRLANPTHRFAADIG